MNRNAVEFAFSKVIEIILFLLFFIVMIYIIATWRDQSYGILDRLFGLFK